MPLPSPNELVASLQELKLLTPAQCQELGKGPDGTFADSRALARSLVERRWLTAFQARQLLEVAVHWHGFSPSIDLFAIGGLGHPSRSSKY